MFSPVQKNLHALFMKLKVYHRSSANFLSTASTLFQSEPSSDDQSNKPSTRREINSIPMTTGRKLIMVLSGKYRNFSSIPDYIGIQEWHRAQDKSRIYVMFTMMAFFMGGAVVFIMNEKRERTERMWVAPEDRKK